MSNSTPESQMIFRVPPKIAEQLNELFKKTEGEDTIELVPTTSMNKNGESLVQFKFRMGDFESRASIIDLPCVIESYKTLDNVNLFKAGNISQMVYVHPNGEKLLEEVPDFDKLAKKVVEPKDSEICCKT